MTHVTLDFIFHILPEQGPGLRILEGNEIDVTGDKLANCSTINLYC